MNQPDLTREVRLTIPARQDYALVASMTLCGLGMSAGLDMDLLGEVRLEQDGDGVYGIECSMPV